MSKTKKVRVTIEGYVPDDFPVKDTITSGSPSTAAFLPIYLHDGERTVKLETHMTTKAKVLSKPKPEPDAFLLGLDKKIARVEQESWVDAQAKQYTLVGLRLARAMYREVVGA
jgi:hypothetical protein